MRPTVLLTAKHLPAPGAEPQRQDHVKTVADKRWGRCDWKTTGLLANCLSLQEAINAGYDSSWFVDKIEQGEAAVVREGASSNAWIVTQDGVLVTHPTTEQILGGCTRTALLEVAKTLQLKVEERNFTLAEALGAAEAFNSSSTSYVRPILSVNGTPIGTGKMGAVTLRLHQAFVDRLERGDGLSHGLV